MPLYLRLLQHGFALELAAIWPCVLLLLTIGIITSILQAVLQIEDATFALLPKCLVMIALALAGGFGALNILGGLAKDFIIYAPALVHQSWY